MEKEQQQVVDSEQPEVLDTEEGSTTETVVETAQQDESVSAEDLGRLLEDARNKADDNWNQVIRAKAEMDNLKKRHARELENAHKYALDKFVAELVGVWDTLELGHEAAQDASVDVTKLREGTELTLKMLTDVMTKFGVEQHDPQGEMFNPELHQAMSMLPRDDVPANTVVAVIQKGYSLNGRLVRPAMVMVSQET